MRLSYSVTTLIALTTLTSAWPWPPAFLSGSSVARIEGSLERRQDNNNNGQTSDSAKATPSMTTSVAKQTGSKSESGSGSQGTATTATKQGSKTATGTDSKHTTTKSSSINPAAGFGGISMVEPAVTSGSQYYRVGAEVTWVWNYTSLLVKPAAIDIVATVTGVAAPSPFTLARNASFAETQTFTWDTGRFASESPLPVGNYRLLVYDAALGAATETPGVGGLAAYNDQFYFGMYTSLPYTALANPFVCATCNAAGGQMERLTWRMLGGVVGITIATFLWVGVGNGVLL